MGRMEFSLITSNGTQNLSLDYRFVFAVGYTGRDTEKILSHIRELETDLGVPAPARIPTIFPLSPYLVTQSDILLDSCPRCSGKAEYVILLNNGHIYIGLGSDHTDRELEASSILKAKQVCGKPISHDLWDYNELQNHWDEISLRSWQIISGVEIPYQQGTLADILPVERIIQEIHERTGIQDSCVIYAGTVPLLDGFRYGSRFRCEMEDLQLGRKLTLSYSISTAQVAL